MQEEDDAGGRSLDSIALKIGVWVRVVAWFLIVLGGSLWFLAGLLGVRTWGNTSPLRDQEMEARLFDRFHAHSIHKVRSAYVAASVWSRRLMYPLRRGSDLVGSSDVDRSALNGARGTFQCQANV
jgi:hypothetical protein